jgi:hypothetical protein
MPSTYTRIVPVTLAFLLFAGVATFAQEQPRPAPGAPQPGVQQPAPPTQPAPRTPAPAPSPTASQSQAKTQTARGELTSVDATSKMLTIKPTEGAEQKFQYNDSTKVTGDRAGVAGLATLSGKQVTVHFNMQGANRIVTEIEVEADKK